MKKEDLKNGNVIETKNGEKFLVSKKTFIRLNGEGAGIFESYSDDLKYNHNSEYDVVKIYEDYTLTNLLWKRPEPKPELSAKEKNILVQALSDGYKWIARDKDNEVWLFDVKPYKEKYCDFLNVWIIGYENDARPLNLCEDLFTFIQWEDKEPRKIKDLLVGEEIGMNVEKLQQIEKDLGFDLALLIEILQKQEVYSKFISPRTNDVQILHWDQVIVDFKRKMILYNDKELGDKINDFSKAPLSEYGKTWAATLEELVVEGEKYGYVK